jgi:hypothetical protein
VVELGAVVGQAVPVSLSECTLLDATTLAPFASLGLRTEAVAAQEAVAEVRSLAHTHTRPTARARSPAHPFLSRDPHAH